MQPVENDIFQKTLNYLRFQKDIYGNDFYFTHSYLLNQNQPGEKEKSLQSFRETIENCTKCALAKTRNHFVFGVGNPKANLMLIGEAPGEDEDLKGEPFVGKAGQLLDKILAAINFNRNEIFICNILKCRPTHNRDPLPDEIQHCLPYLEAQVQLIQPKVILALGRIAGQTLLNSINSLNKLRDNIHYFQEIPLMVTFHPAALLRNPQWKRLVWEDVQKLRQLYDKLVGDKPKWQLPRK
jgi:DNA polymerase